MIGRDYLLCHGCDRMKKILIIDDSALMRRVMSDIINSEPEMCVTDTAENGKIAVELLEKHRNYDCILLDINMPKMDGVSFLKYLSENRYTIPTLVVSSIASRSAKETMLALELGAYDFVRKPEGLRGISSGEFRDQLLLKIKCAFKIKKIQYPEKAAAGKTDSGKESGQAAPVSYPHTKNAGKGSILFIASSTGGPKALQSVIPKFPADIGCPIVVVQHMPAGFTGSLAERLDEMSQCRVVEAEDGAVLENGVVYVAKGGYQLSIGMTGRNEHRLAVRKDEARNGLRPCADIFLESLLDSGYKKIFCAVLTGMGSDGTEGLKQLKRLKDVYTVGQNEESCVVYGMPRAAAKAGLVDEVADLQEVAGLLIAALQQNGG